MLSLMTISCDRIISKIPGLGGGQSAADSQVLIEALALKGSAKKIVHVVDSVGEHLVVITKDSRTTQEGQFPNKHVRITVQDLVLGQEGKYKEFWSFQDSTDCNMDLIYSMEQFAVTDLQLDHVAEVWFIIVEGCKTDVAPDQFKLVLFERGAMKVLGGSNALQGFAEVEKKIDQVFKGYDDKYKKQARTMCSAIMEDFSELYGAMEPQQQYETSSSGGYTAHAPCMFGVKLPSSYRLEAPYSDNNEDQCSYVVKTSSGFQIMELNAMLKERFDYWEVKDLYARALRKNDIDVRYKAQKGNWFVISGYERSSGLIIYWKRAVGENYISDMYIKYPKSMKQEIEPHLAVISKSFTSD